MFARLFLALMIVLTLGACASFKKKPYKEADEKKHEAAGPDNDVSFQAFLGTLRKAVAKKDVPLIASMMTTDFGYRWDASPPGENVFHYWDENNVWPELQVMMEQEFHPLGDFMVTPIQFANAPESYHGYRAGIQRVGGAWKFAYFVTE